MGKYDITIEAKNAAPKGQSFGQLKLRKLVLQERFIGKGNSPSSPITVGLQEPPYSRIYHQLSQLKGVNVPGDCSISQFDDLFYGKYIRVVYLSREIKVDGKKV